MTLPWKQWVLWAPWWLIMSGRVSAFASGIIDVGMQFSDKKNVCTASRHAISREITKRVSMVNIKPARDVVSLGSAFAAGTRRTTVKAKARLRAFLCSAGGSKRSAGAKVSAARVLRTGLYLRTHLWQQAAWSFRFPSPGTAQGGCGRRLHQALRGPISTFP